MTPSAIHRLAALLLVLVHALGGAAPGPGAVERDAAPPAQAAPAQSTLPWLDDGATPARRAVELLRNAPADGLDPAAYGAEELARRLDGPLDGQGAAAFERDLDSSMSRFLNDVHTGRVDAGYRASDRTASDFDPHRLLAAAYRNGRLDQVVGAAAPPLALYRRVKQSLAQYRELARLYPEWPALPAVPGRGIAAGAPYAGAAMLRQRLQLLSDLDPEADVATGSDSVYTEELAAAVKRFQARHGLAPDGVLGPDTLDALAVPLTQRVAQLALTLERLRWLPPLARGRVVAVNLPAYRLWAFDTTHGAAEPVLEMRVIVGTALTTQTPLFVGRMQYLEINPYWNVPHSIAAGEIAPKLASDPGYLRRNDMELVSAAGAIVAETPGAPAALRAGTLRVRQRPGHGNVLGALKFAMPNPMNIYLHSTSAQALFDRTRRDLSHGCIRVEQPVDLAQFVLADPLRWDRAALQAAIDGGRTRTVALATPVPVVLFYATALADSEGHTLFAQDIYRLDDALVRRLHLR